MTHSAVASAARNAALNPSADISNNVPAMKNTSGLAVCCCNPAAPIMSMAAALATQPIQRPRLRLCPSGRGSAPSVKSSRAGCRACFRRASHSVTMATSTPLMAPMASVAGVA